MDRQPILEGERLLLRPLSEADWNALYSVASDPLIWEQHPVGDRWQESVFRNFFDEALREGGALVAIDSDSERVIGASQFRSSPFDPHAIEIGWTFLARAAWGSGFNTEMKRLMVGYALGSVPRVLFRVGETNRRSRGAMEKIGGRLTDLIQEAEHNGRTIRHVVYEIDRTGFADGPLSGRV